MQHVTFCISTIALAFMASVALAQAPMSYGATITLESAKKAAAPAVAEATRNNWAMAVAIVDTAGNLVYFEKMQDTQTGSVEVAIEKARTAALFRRPTKLFQDSVAAVLQRRIRQASHVVIGIRDISAGREINQPWIPACDDLIKHPLHPPHRRLLAQSLIVCGKENTKWLVVAHVVKA